MAVMKRSSDYGESLDYFYWKFKYNTSDNSFTDLVKRLNASGIQLKTQGQIHRYLNRVLEIEMDRYDCCINNCMAFTGLDTMRRRCILCGEARFFEDDGEVAGQEFYSDIYQMSKLQSKAQYSYLPLIPRLRLLYANKDYARKMRYPATLESEPWLDGVRDVWDGEMMRKWKRQGRWSPLPH